MSWADNIYVRVRGLKSMSINGSFRPGQQLSKRSGDAQMPLISIITPFYNSGDLINETYNSVMNQTFPWYEWIIVDDGSTDAKSLETLKKLAKTDNRIKIVQQENSGVSAARNKGAKESKTEIYVFLDSDDLIEPQYLELVYWGLYFNPSASWCYTDSYAFGDVEHEWVKYFSSEGLKNENILQVTSAIRKQAFNQVGGFYEQDCNVHEDWLLWLRMVAKGMYPVHVGEKSFWYRRMEGGRCTSIESMQVPTENNVIEIAKAEIQKPVEAVRYPNTSPANTCAAPKFIPWDRKVYPDHDKINVGMLLPWLEMGGADLFNLDLLAGLDTERFRTSVLTTIRGKNSWENRFKEITPDIFHMPNFLTRDNFTSFISYFIQSREIDVLFVSNTTWGYGILPWIRTKFPDLAIVDYVHMEEWYWRNGGHARTSGGYGEVLERTYVCNGRTEKVMVEHFNRKPESVKTVYIGTDAQEYMPEKIEEGQAYQTLGIEKERPIVLFPCRMHPQKRPFLMLEIAKKMLKLGSNAAFVAVGDGQDLEEMQRYVADNQMQDVVFFAGRQHDMKPYYRDASVTLICSVKEGLALTAFESMAMKTPVVTSDVGGQAELVDEETGVVLPLMIDEAENFDSRFFKQEEIDAYVNALLGLLQDREALQKRSELCRKRILNGFTKNHMIAYFEEEFVRLTGPEAKKKRHETCKKLSEFPQLCSELVTLVSESDKLDVIAEELWRLMLDKQAALDECQQSQTRLNEIYEMRSWKLVQKYMNFMNKSKIGQGLRQFVAKILGRR